MKKKWKIQTCNSKFTIIPIRDRKYTDHLKTKSNGKFLGLKISTNGYGRHITETVNKAKFKLSKLYNLRELHYDQKRTIYNMTVRPLLTYPAIPLVTASKNEKYKLQKIQNLAAKIITNYKFYEEGPITAEELNQRANLIPINLILEKQANNIWEKISETEPDLYKQLQKKTKKVRKKPRPGFYESIPILKKSAKPFYTITEKEYEEDKTEDEDSIEN